MSGRHSRNKGANEERAIVNLHRERGIPARRTLASGARSDGSETYDIDLFPNGEQAAALIGECKIRGKGFTQIYKWLGLNDWLSIRCDKRERLYVVPERVWLKLIASKEAAP